MADVFKGQGSGFSVSGTVQAGSVQVGDRLVIMPQGEVANVKGNTQDYQDIPDLLCSILFLLP